MLLAAVPGPSCLVARTSFEVSLQTAMSPIVAFLGPLGTYSHQVRRTIVSLHAVPLTVLLLLLVSLVPSLSTLGAGRTRPVWTPSQVPALPNYLWSVQPPAISRQGLG